MERSKQSFEKKLTRVNFESISGMQLVSESEHFEASSSQLSGNTERYENVPRPPGNEVMSLPAAAGRCWKKEEL